jgi:hypothetical protein
MDFKSNLNRIHYLLTEKFNNVTIIEKSNQKLGSYIELSVKENLECKILIRKVDLELPNVNFLYLTNPLNEQSSVISRVSNVEIFADSINDIIKNERFDSEYIDSIK